MRPYIYLYIFSAFRPKTSFNIYKDYSTSLFETTIINSTIMLVLKSTPRMHWKVQGDLAIYIIKSGKMDQSVQSKDVKRAAERFLPPTSQQNQCLFIIIKAMNALDNLRRWLR